MLLGGCLIEKFDIDVVIADKTVPFSDGLLHPDVMEVLKHYRYSRSEFIFDEIKIELGHDMSQKAIMRCQMQKSVTFLYGF